ncbi:hypothetical protein A4H97_21115 [Niastella yeongjuensis]|uniref:Lipocalin-like domain-containing protein n=1 Tax=Niastella yeongjuensis TaxID=354355 RepID=A0A1V9FCQ4_9BACT|nr:hypothetical protein [Niastella yeongjuensis]OQP56081.1 hypothetical protein A4H97_21115 [Niastella yeongjuensis]SEP23812.1 hypothetical protein SAMN05660816_04852 [Niastella yeongjuensis]
MKTIRIASALALAALIFACNKDDDKHEEPKKKPAELIAGQWHYVNQRVIERINGKIDSLNYNYGEKDSVTYFANGTAISVIPSRNYSDTTTYRFIDDSSFVQFDGDTSKILSITEHELKYYTRYSIITNRAGDYGEDWEILNR